MHKSLVVVRKTRGYTRYLPALFSLLFCLIGRCSRRWSLGVQEQEIPEGAYYDVEFPVDQEYLGGSQAGGLAFSIVLCLC